jgi:PAS domain S-box-containing protein
LDAALVVRELERSGYTTAWEQAEDAAELKAALARGGWDLVLSDYSLPRFSGLEALEIVKASGLDLPFLLISGAIGEDVAVGAMVAGAHDYLLKDHLARLGAAVARELREAEERRARRRAEAAAQAAQVETCRLLQAAEEDRRTLLSVVENLRWAEAKTRLQTTALNAAANAILITDPAGIILWTNPAFTVLTGYGPAEACGQTPRCLKSGRQDPGFYENLWETILSGQVWRGEITNRHQQGHLYVEETTITPLRDEQGQIIHFIAVMQDITVRKQTEANQQLVVDALQLLNHPDGLPALVEELLRLIQRTAGFDAVGLRLRQGEDFPFYVQSGFSGPFVQQENSLCAKNVEGAVVRGADGQPILECACGAVLSGGGDPSQACFTGGGSFWTSHSPELLALAPDRDPRRHPRNRCIEAGYQSVALIPLRAGAEIIGLLQLNDRSPGRFTLELVRFYEGLAASIGIALARQRMEDALRASLAEKTVLLKEVHHRVKNNLQIVSSLLNLQAAQVKNPAALGALRETQGRIRSMALLHEMLYQSENLAGIDFDGYLDRLCAQLFCAFGSPAPRIKLQASAPGIRLGLDQAVPCCLIINELVSNALKYAFPEGRTGRIAVALEPAGSQQLRLTVGDDGTGLPAALDLPQAKSLGLPLVAALATQLKGRLEVVRQPGATFHVTFPLCL